MSVDVLKLIKRYDVLSNQRRTWELHWQDLADFILPRKNGVTFRATPGRKQTDRLFDSTAIHANELLAASMQGALTSGTVKWFRLKMRQPELNDRQDIREWLDASSNAIYSAFQQSNFNSEMQEVYLDLGAFGVSSLMLEERDKLQSDVPTTAFGGFRFRSLQLGEYAVAEDAEGRVNTLYRRFNLSVLNVVEQWSAAKKSDRLSQLVETKPDEPIEVIHGVYPRPKPWGTAAKRKPWASVYFLREEKLLLAESGYDEFPYMVPRWTKTSGETYGRGPGHTALPDIKTLNKSKELTLKAWAKSVDPPMKQLSDGVIGQVKLYPGGTTTVTDMDALQPLESKARFDVGEVQTEHLQTAIRDVFFNSQLQLPNKTIMTATEVERLYELMQRILGPTLGRLESELLKPLIERAFAVMARAGAIPPPPQDLAGFDPDIDIEYEGPLARAQRGADVAAIQGAVNDITPLASIDPTVLDVLDLDETARFIALTRGVPPKLVRDAAKVQTIRDSRNQAAAQRQQMEQAGQVAAAAGKAAPMVKALTSPDAAAALQTLSSGADAGAPEAA